MTLAIKSGILLYTNKIVFLCKIMCLRMFSGLQSSFLLGQFVVSCGTFLVPCGFQNTTKIKKAMFGLNKLDYGQFWVNAVVGQGFTYSTLFFNIFSQYIINQMYLLLETHSTIQETWYPISETLLLKWEILNKKDLCCIVNLALKIEKLKIEKLKKNSRDSD